MINGRDTKCLQVSLNLPGEENWPIHDHHHNNNFLFFFFFSFLLRKPEDTLKFLLINSDENGDKHAHPEDFNEMRSVNDESHV